MTRLHADAATVPAPEPVPEFLQTITAWQALVWIGALLAVLAFFVKAWPTIRRVVHTLEALTTLPETLRGLKTDIGSLKADLARIDHELHPNSGRSTRDQIDIIRNDLKALHEKIDKENT